MGIKELLQKYWPSLILFLLLSYGAALIGNIATYSSVNTWYQTIEKPTWNPPRWIFGPVWTLLYFMIACSGWVLWTKTVGDRPTFVLVIYFVHLGLNALWSVMFFGLQSPGLGLIEIIFLWTSIVVYAILSWPYSPIASILFWPYGLWVGYAAALNFRIWQMNT